MPVLENAKHEAFCQNMIIHRDNATKSYIEAGYSADEESARRLGSKLLTNVDVKARLDELRQDVEKRDLVTMEEAIEAFKRIATAAEADDQLNVAKGCWDSLTKTMGGFVDKKEISGPNGSPVSTITYEVVDTKDD